MRALPTSVYPIILFNLALVVGLLFFGLSMWEVVFVYILEALVMVLFFLLKIGYATYYSYTQASPEERGSIVGILLGLFALFFFIGFFPLGFVLGSWIALWSMYFQLGMGAGTPPVIAQNILIAGFLALGSHSFSFLFNFIMKKEYIQLSKSKNSKLLTVPIFRIIPVFFCAWFMPFLGIPLILIPLKTIGDIYTHMSEHEFYKLGTNIKKN